MQPASCKAVPAIDIPSSLIHAAGQKSRDQRQQPKGALSSTPHAFAKALDLQFKTFEKALSIVACGFPFV
jgi:hypothetical protein